MANKDDEILSFLTSMMSEQRDARSESVKAISDLDKKVDLHIQKTEYELKRINEQDEIQNGLLDQHIEGVNTLRKIFENHEAADVQRFQSLEEPRRFIRKLWRLFLGIGGGAGVVAGLAEAWFRLKGN